MNGQSIETNSEGNGLEDALLQMTNLLEGDAIIYEPPAINSFSGLSNLHKITADRGCHQLLYLSVLLFERLDSLQFAHVMPTVLLSLAVKFDPVILRHPSETLTACAQKRSAPR